RQLGSKHALVSRRSGRLAMDQLSEQRLTPAMYLRRAARRRAGPQASSPWGSPSLGRYTRKSFTESNVASARIRQTSSVKALWYSLTELSNALYGSAQLFIAPDGELSRLPFCALPLANGAFLIDEFRIDYLGVGRDLLRKGARPVGRAAPPLIVADP